MAFTAVTALVTGTAEVTAGLVLSAVAEVGMALTVVGGVTGNKDLMKIGGVMSLVGGVGGMINGAVGGAASASSVAEGAESMESMSALADAANGGAAGAEASQAAGIEAMGGDSSGIISGAQGANTAMPDLAVKPNPTDMRLQTGTQATPSTAPAQPSAQTTTVNDIKTPSGVQAPQGPTEVSTPYSQGVTMGGQNAPVSSGNFFNKFSQFAEKNKTLFNSGMQVIGGALKGANDRDMFDQQMALRNQYAARGNSVGNFAPGIISGARQ